MYLMPLFIGQGRYDLLCGDIDDFAGGQVGRLAVDAPTYPARGFAELDALHLFGRHDRGIEDVDVFVVAVDDPDFLFVVREGDAVAGTAMPLHRSLLKALYIYAVPFLSRLDIANLKAEQAVHVDETECV